MTKMFLAAAALCGVMATQAYAQGKQDFTLINRTGYTIDQVYVAPSSSDSWESDVMGRDVLGNGERVNISFSRGERTCKWDMKVVYDDKETAEWDGFDLCQVSKIVLRYDRNSGRTWAEYE